MNDSRLIGDNQDALEYALKVIENVVIGKTAIYFKKYFSYTKLAEIYSKALNKPLTQERLIALVQRYNKGGEKS